MKEDENADGPGSVEGDRGVEGTIAETGPQTLGDPVTAGSREVKGHEVIPYATKTCRACCGQGFYGMAKKLYYPGEKKRQIQITGKNWPTTGRICGCALSRFIRRNANALMFGKNGAFKWRPADELPAIVPHADPGLVP